MKLEGTALHGITDGPFTVDGYPLCHYTMNSFVEFRNSSINISDFPNGTSNTWLSSEIAGQYRPWAEPAHWRELDWPPNSSATGLGRPGGDGVLIGLVDGSVRDFGQDTDPEVFKALSGGLALPDSERRRISSRKRAVRSSSMEALSLHEEETPSHVKGGHQPYLEVHILHDETDRVLIYYRGYSPMTVADLKVSADSYVDAEYALFGMTIDKNALPQLCRFSKLKRLTIRELKLDQEGLNTLRTCLPDLRHLRTSLSADLGLDEFKAAMPDVQIEIDPSEG